MFKDIIKTISSRYLVAFLNLLLIFVNSKVLGREGTGMIGVIYVSANIAVIFNSILCGNTIVYFMNRYNLRYVFPPAYVWAFAGSSVACCVMYLFGMLPEGYGLAIFVLAALMSLVGANTSMLLGKDNVTGFNLVFILQGIFMFVVLLFVYFIVGYKNINGYLSGLFTAYIIAYAYSFVLLLPHLSRKKNVPVNASFRDVLREMFVYGMWGGTDNLAEGLTIRLNYFLVRNAGGYGYVGLLDSGTKISESVWHISNSVSYIEYNRVSKMTERKEQKRVTLQLFKLTYCALVLMMAVITCIPEWVYTEYLLTPEFSGIRKVIIALSFGIVALGSNRILSHYFIGSGNIKYSAFSSVCGFILLFATGRMLIPAHGVFGAALTSSIAYAGMLFFSLVVFMKQTRTSVKELLPSDEDLMTLRGKISGIVLRKRGKGDSCR
jgi:O-antigen/teichoic acid export membrane protein